MKTLAYRSTKLGTICSLLLGTAPGVLAADVLLHKVPALTVEQAPAYLDNLARYHLGASIETTGSDQQVAQSALLSGDPAASYPLSAGKTTLVVALPKIENVDSVSFRNLGAKGAVTIATSSAKLPANSPQWTDAARQDLSSEGVKAKIGPGEAKYVRLTFDVTEPGNISGFGLYAPAAMSDFTAARGGDKSVTMGLVSYSRTDIHSKSRALYVSSGSDLKQANNIIDDQTSTSYNFAAEDGTPTTVVDLGKVSTIRRVSAVYAPKAGSMQFYVLNSLPAAANAGETVKLDEAAFAAMTPVGAAEDDGSQGRASVDFPETSGRYVMVRWTPAVQQDSSFSLAEIAAIGGTGNSNQLLAANIGGGAVSTDEAQSDGKTMMDGKTMIDSKDMPGEGPVDEAPQSPGEGPPPTLPQPPPFTFVPVLVPNSP